MVKGISRQVIVVKSPDPSLFEQAIFILKDSAVREGITDQMLMKQARQAIGKEKRGGWQGKLFWFSLGVFLAGGLLGLILVL